MPDGRIDEVRRRAEDYMYELGLGNAVCLRDDMPGTGSAGLVVLLPSCSRMKTKVLGSLPEAEISRTLYMTPSALSRETDGRSGAPSPSPASLGLLRMHGTDSGWAEVLADALSSYLWHDMGASRRGGSLLRERAVISDAVALLADAKAALLSDLPHVICAEAVRQAFAREGGHGPVDVPWACDGELQARCAEDVLRLRLADDRWSVLGRNDWRSLAAIGAGTSLPALLDRRKAVVLSIRAMSTGEARKRGCLGDRLALAACAWVSHARGMREHVVPSADTPSLGYDLSVEERLRENACLHEPCVTQAEIDQILARRTEVFDSGDASAISEMLHEGKYTPEAIESAAG